MVGLVEDLQFKTSLNYKGEGDTIFLIGQVTDDIASSLYLSKVKGINFSPAPHFDLEKEFATQALVAKLIENNWIESAHDISEGGLMVSLLEKGFYDGLGFDVKKHGNFRNDAFWFGEGQGRVVVTCSEDQLEGFRSTVGASGVEVIELGKVTAGTVRVNGENWGIMEDWKELYDTAIERKLSKELESEGALGMI